MTLQTDRLTLLPLSAHRLELWASDIPALEKELHCVYNAEPMEGVFREIVKGQIDICKRDEQNLLYHTFWLLILKSGPAVVGSADFKHPPNANGEVEIGYGLAKCYEKYGYMTEAVMAMKEWAFQDPRITALIAETETGNAASKNVLLRCGFRLDKRAETLWWKLTK